VEVWEGFILPIVQMANMALRFLLELCAMYAVGYWGYHIGGPMIVKWVLALSLPLLLAVVWGWLGSPQAPIKLVQPWHLLLELLVFGLPAVALFASGKQDLAVWYGIAAVINRILMFIWQQ